MRWLSAATTQDVNSNPGRLLDVNIAFSRPWSPSAFTGIRNALSDIFKAYTNERSISSRDANVLGLEFIGGLSRIIMYDVL